MWIHHNIQFFPPFLISPLLLLTLMVKMHNVIIIHIRWVPSLLYFVDTQSRCHVAIDNVATCSLLWILGYHSKCILPSPPNPPCWTHRTTTTWQEQHGTMTTTQQQWHSTVTQHNNNLTTTWNHNMTRTRNEQRGPTTTPNQHQQQLTTTTKDNDGPPCPPAPIIGHNGPPTPPTQHEHMQTAMRTQQVLERCWVTHT